MDEENANLWEELSNIEDGILEEFANDPKNFGKRGSAFNPSVHINCHLEDGDDMISAAVELSECAAMVLMLKQIGWELDGPLIDGIVNTYWDGEGEPPTDCSSYVEKDGVLKDVNGEVFEDDDDE